MKKLLLCTLITSILYGSLVAQEQNTKISKTPTLDALKATRKNLLKKYDDLYSQKSQIIDNTIDKDEKLQNLKKQIEDEKEKTPEVIAMNKKLKELEQKEEAFFKKQYPENYKIMQNEDFYSETAEVARYKITDKDSEFKKLRDERIEKMFQVMLYSNSKIKKLNDQIDQRQKEIKEEQCPELKPIKQEIEEIDKKLEKINKNPKIKNLQNKIEELNKKQITEFEKIEPQVTEIMKKESKETDSLADVLKRLQTTTYKFKPEIEKIDKDLASLNEKLKMLKEKLIIEINKKDAPTK
jgi:hypothetical protein